MKQILGRICGGKLVEFRYSEVNRCSNMRNSDIDFIAQRARMQENGDDAVANCVNFAAAQYYAEFGQMDRVRELGRLARLHVR